MIVLKIKTLWIYIKNKILCHIYQLRPKEIRLLIIILIIIIFSNLIKIKNLHKSILMGIKDINDCFNSNKNESNLISFSY